MPRLAPHAFALLLSLTACHVTPHAPGPPSTTPPPAATPSTTPPAEVRLLPGPSSAEDMSFTVENGGRAAIDGLHAWPGLVGHFERQGPDGQWFPHGARGGYCATVEATGPLAPAASLTVGELPAMGHHVFPPGRYRFVLPYREVDGSATRQVSLPFTVEGLDAAESAALIDAFQSRVCSWPHRAFLLEVVERTAAPTALPRLIDLPMVASDPFDQRLAPLQVAARFPEQEAPLVDIVEHGAASTAVPTAVALLRETSCGGAPKRCRAAVTRLMAALGDDGELSRTTSDSERVAIAEALAGAGRSDTKLLGPHASEAVAALRRAAGKVRDRAARARILDDAHDIAEALGDELARDEVGVGLPSVSEDWTMTPACQALLSQIAPLLRFRTQPLAVRYGVSSTEPYREAPRD